MDDKNMDDKTMDENVRGDKAIYQQLCTNIFLIANEKIDFKSLEKNLICGDPQIKEWQNIPLPQAKIHIKAALQERGYNHIRIIEKNEQLVIYVGSLTKVTDILINGFSYDHSLWPYHNLIGRILTPSLLDEIQSHLQQQLWREGIPCAQYKVIADADTGIIMIKIENAKKLKILSVKNETPILKMNLKVMARYYAFHIGEIFNSNYMELTMKRMVTDGIVQNARYTVECDGSNNLKNENKLKNENNKNEGVVIKHHFVVGKSRLITAGVGTSNEQYFILRLSWKNVRLGPHGSSAEVVALASSTEQRLNISSNWYPSISFPKFYIRPNLELVGEREEYYRTISQYLKLELGSSLDTSKINWHFNIGPVFNHQVTYRGIGPKESTFLTTNAFIELISHDFEYYRTSPRSGLLLNFFTIGAQKQLLSSISAYRFSLTGEYLYNVYNLNPPILILGLRGKASTSFIPELANQKQEIPLLFRHFLGGVDDLRGFDRKQLPRDPEGALSSLYGGWEARFPLLFYDKLQPLIFIDSGWLSKKSFKLDSTIYWSPGAGFRFESPFGTFRGVVAYGQVSHGNENEEEKAYFRKVKYYLSYGQEF
ncbi:MAG: BamA/TamA family outer membrane protein [Oligoflexia bacterium]|nr:BamA/TamA family outer membrane protein [Oligoflexia bacterium]